MSRASEMLRVVGACPGLDPALAEQLMYRGLGPMSPEQEQQMRARIYEHVATSAVIARPDQGGEQLWAWSLSASHNGQQIASDAQSVTMESGKYRGQRLCDVPGGGEDYMLWIFNKGPERFARGQFQDLSLLLHWVQFRIDNKETWEGQPLPEVIRGKRYMRVFATTGFTVPKGRRLKQVEECALSGVLRSLENVDTLGQLWVEIEGALLSKPLWANCMCSHMFLEWLIFSKCPSNPDVLMLHCAWGS